MNTVLKYASAAVLTGALALTAITPSQAGDRAAAAAIGFGAGAIVGAAAASSYHNGYYYGPGYYAEPGYAYGPAYAYEPAPVYVAPAPRYYRYRANSSGCVTAGNNGTSGDYSFC